MADIARAAMVISLALLLCSSAVFSQEMPSGELPPLGGQTPPVEDPILYPVNTPPEIELINDGPNSESCLGRCQEECENMPLDCGYIADSLPVNCQNNRGKCLDSCDGVLCECVGICEEGCTNGVDCESNCIGECFAKHGFHRAGVEEVLPETTPPNPM